MLLFSRVMFKLVDFAARKGLAQDPAGSPSKQAARTTGIRGETYAYWYLRRNGYVFVARNYTAPGIKGEIDLVGYDGPVLAFVEVKTRATSKETPVRPEEAVNSDKRRNVLRMARRFLRERRMESAPCRFDILAIESRSGQSPIVRLHKGAFRVEGQ